MSESTMLDVGDAAKFFGVSKATIYKWISSGKLEASTSYHFRRGRLLVKVAP